MRSSTSLLGRIFMGIASEMLEILTKILKIIELNPKSWTQPTRI